MKNPNLSIYINQQEKRCLYCGEKLFFDSWTEKRKYCKYDCSPRFNNFISSLNRHRNSKSLIVKNCVIWCFEQIELGRCVLEIKPIFNQVVKHREGFLIPKRKK